MLRARLEHRLPGFALRAEFAIPAQGVTAVFGPSGAGKTTLLRCLAGLERAATGSVEVNGTAWQDDARGIFLAPHRRAVGYVFQDAGLFSHLSVRGNLGFGYRRTPPAQRRVAWDDIIGRLDLGALLPRRTGKLSGGERQRVAIARALLASPQLLLMDEPLAALDGARKREILPVLARLQRELALPLLYVSHQLEEIAQLADHLVVVEAGQVLASGPLDEVLARLDLPIAQYEDAGAIVTAQVAGHDARHCLTRLTFAGGELLVADASPVPAGTARVRVRIRARDVSLARSEHRDSSILNRFPVTVVEIAGANHPAYAMVRLDAGGVPLLARITQRSCEELGIGVGVRVWAQVKSVAMSMAV
jgi:molybdate transport system ATP-binding protein